MVARAVEQIVPGAVAQLTGAVVAQHITQFVPAQESVFRGCTVISVGGGFSAQPQSVRPDGVLC